MSETPKVQNIAGVPARAWRAMAEPPKSELLPSGLDAWWDAAAAFVSKCQPRTKVFLARAAKTAALSKEYETISDANLKDAAAQLREKFRRGRETPEELERAFAVIREVAFREKGMRPFLVQLAGAFAIEAGCIAEMATGEGKTLTATMPAVIAGWRGRGCHVITVNDYLAKRDAGLMEKLYKFCGLSVSYLEQKTPPNERKIAYEADITYCTNKEVAADFLRDRLAMGRLKNLPALLISGGGGRMGNAVQRGLPTAIIDEADSVLIDEAVTPLIISGAAPNKEQVDAFKQAVEIAAQLLEEHDYKVNPRYREIDLTERGKERLEILSQDMGGLWQGARRREEVITQALTARHFYSQGKQYVIQDGKVVIVDEFTGRLMPDREWRDGLHQAVQAKEQLEVLPPKDTYARISFQRFFRMYRKISGMTGTASEAWREFWQIYHTPVAVIPTNRPCIRVQMPDKVYASEAAKWAAVVEEIKRLHAIGRPVLVGTRSVRASEHLSTLLAAENLPHEVLNAVRHAEEARIVTEAGQPGAITVATNMAGRGTDIQLGRGIAELGGLHVIATERHEAGRIDRQLFGRCARQGDPGSSQAIVSLEDELVHRHVVHLSALMRKRYGGTIKEISSFVTRQPFELAQKRASKLSLRQRKGVLRTDDWLDEYLGFAGKEG